MAEESAVASASPATGSSVGMLLRRAREKVGYDIPHVSQALRIRTVYLRAIEEGNFRELPGSTYAVGFVRTYSDYLGLDGPEIVRRFREEVEEVGRRPELIFPTAPTEAKIPGGAILLVALLLAVIAYGGWYALSDRESSLFDSIAALPGELRDAVGGGDSAETAEAPADATASDTAAAPSIPAPAPTPTPTVAAPTLPSATEPATPAADATATVTDSAAGAVPALPTAPATASDATASAGTTATDPAATDTIAPVDPAAVEGASAATEATAAATTSETATLPGADGAVATESAEAATPPATEEAALIPPAPAAPDPLADLPRGETFGVSAGEARVVLIATQESWVQITDADKQEIWTRVLRAGDRYLVPDQEGLTLSTGNAGGLEVLVDGNRVPSLGPIGLVRRAISLDPQRLLNGTAVP